VFGKAGGFAASLDLATLNGSNGFRIDGVDELDLSGGSVSSAGDMNGDGFDDNIIGAPFADPGGDLGAGESYVVFGRAPDAAVRRVGSAADQTIRGGDFNDTLIGRGGDDVLAGGAGHVRLKGGPGADDFCWRAVPSPARTRSLISAARIASRSTAASSAFPKTISRRGASSWARPRKTRTIA